MADCNSCKERRNQAEPVPYIAHESAMARCERTAKRLLIALMVSIAMLFASNLAWLWYINQYDFESYSEQYEYTQDGQGVNIIGDYNGVDYNGAEADSNQTN